ncbi:hypothetical protein HHI36_018890 [Cryptolaemus montrouzieri]|uniref:Uncharacterized protein n=1 Tax=Cryptolaemus montrouzieri TaxID=559131 RepID=A0ABD2P1T2_9CUCU
MKRKRRDLCPSPFLDEGPKRTKVHAQRKFAQGSNVNSPVITPVKEFEKTDRSSLDLTPEPVELLPIRRPNTEDFLTFLCFRGTPLLPPNLNFFNTASIVDTNGQVHEIKSESPKNGPIDTSVITKGGTGTSDRPFIAFGVRKRADPIVISKQMEKKRRHALALQALRRKYQEQKMAKIRAVTISKLSEKPSNRATVRSNSISKIEKVQQTLVTKHPVQKNKVKVISSKHIKITAQPVRTLNSKMKPRMCLRSFRGRFVQQELPFRAVKKHKVPEKKMIIKKNIKKKEECKKTLVIETSSKNENSVVEKKVNKVVKQKDPKMNSQDLNFRVTRSTKVSLKSKIKGKQIIKRRILIPSTSTLVKPRVLRSQTSKTNSTIQSRTRRYLERKGSSIDKLPKTIYKKANLKVINKEVDLKKTVPVAKEITVLKKSEKASTSNCLKASDRVLRNDTTCNLHDTLESKLEKSKEIKTIELPKKDHTKTVQKTEPKLDNKKEKKDAEKHKNCESKKVLEKPKAMPTNEIKKELEKKTSEDKTKVTTTNENKKELEKKTTTKRSKSIDNKSTDTHKVKEKKEIKQPEVEISEEVHAKEQKCSQRPSRKTKEAAAIYMEILSHKLVNEKKVDDDTVSIDSFPELPNVKKTEQRENELKAKAGVSKNEKTNQIEKNVELITNCTFEKENTAQENKRKVNEEKK